MLTLHIGFNLETQEWVTTSEYYAGVASLSPTIPAIIRTMLINRAIFTGSPKSTIPKTTVPTAPTPTQTAYAVPTGSDFMAIPSNQRLMIIDKRVPTVGQNRVKPAVYFNPIAQPTSKNPAIVRMIHVMFFPYANVECTTDSDKNTVLQHSALTVVLT